MKSNKAFDEDIHQCEYGIDMDIESFESTEDVQTRIIDLMREFGLEHGFLDFIIDNTDKLIFLEVNPTGCRAYIEASTGMPITEAASNLVMEEKTTA